MYTVYLNHTYSQFPSAPPYLYVLSVAVVFVVVCVTHQLQSMLLPVHAACCSVWTVLWFDLVQVTAATASSKVCVYSLFFQQKHVFSWPYGNILMRKCTLIFLLETVETALVFPLRERHKYKYCLLVLLWGKVSPEAVDPQPVGSREVGTGLLQSACCTSIIR